MKVLKLGDFVSDGDTVVGRIVRFERLGEVHHAAVQVDPGGTIKMVPCMDLFHATEAEIAASPVRPCTS